MKIVHKFFPLDFVAEMINNYFIVIRNTPEIAIIIDIILNFDRDPNEVYRMIRVIAKAVDDGEIPEKQIDDSVTRILEAKGFRVE